MTGRESDTDQLALAVEHYMAAVSEELLSRDIAVTLIRGVGPHEHDDYCFTDVEGEISFIARGERRSNRILHWSGVSGWCMGSDTDERFYEQARWMGAGLVPPPIDVAIRCESMMNDPYGVGDREVPVYRSLGHDFPELLELLSKYAPKGQRTISPGDRIVDARQEMFLRRILAATSPQSLDDTLTGVALQGSDIRLTVEILEYARASTPWTDIGNLIERVIELFRE